jgi:hypothetical protein
VLAALGAGLAISGMVVQDGPATATNHLLVGMLLFVPSMIPRIVRQAPLPGVRADR